MCIILAVVLLNAVVGVIQEGKAKRALEALEKMTSPHALIHDEDGIREIPAADLIPGDIVCLEAGRQVPADIRIISAVNLKIEESALTGESVPESNFAIPPIFVSIPIAVTIPSSRPYVTFVVLYASF